MPDISSPARPTSLTLAILAALASAEHAGAVASMISPAAPDGLAAKPIVAISTVTVIVPSLASVMAWFPTLLECPASIGLFDEFVLGPRAISPERFASREL